MNEPTTAIPETGESLRLRQSEGIAALAKSLSRAQSQVTAAMKDSQNPHFKSQYADLASVWNACREALTGNCLSVVQSPAYAGGKVLVTTRLLHDSGEWLEGTLAVPVGKSDAHGVGSAITYARRYSLAAMVGVAPDDDDDGNAAATARAVSRDRAQTRQPQQQRPAARQAPQRPSPSTELTDGDVPDVDWTKPLPAVLASKEPHVWYITAVKGLLQGPLKSWGKGKIRLICHYLNPDSPFDADAVVAQPAAAMDFWHALVERSKTVPFGRMLHEAQKLAEETSTA